VRRRRRNEARRALAHLVRGQASHQRQAAAAIFRGRAGCCQLGAAADARGAAGARITRGLSLVRLRRSAQTRAECCAAAAVRRSGRRRLCRCRAFAEALLRLLLGLLLGLFVVRRASFFPASLRTFRGFTLGASAACAHAARPWPPLRQCGRSSTSGPWNQRGALARALVPLPSAVRKSTHHTLLTRSWQQASGKERPAAQLSGSATGCGRASRRWFRRRRSAFAGHAALRSSQTTDWCGRGESSGARARL